MPGKSNRWDSTIGLLVPTSLDLQILELPTIFTFLQTSFLNEEVNCTESSPELVKPDCTKPSPSVRILKLAMTGSTSEKTSSIILKKKFVK